ncbi:hypothetical protein GQ42DRAFT_82955 [Ramicandelaber brevisporus]|nr:hypothetical protein GQ42DRAFT_82955 [Ramicandelaber brevisporus]
MDIRNGISTLSLSRTRNGSNQARKLKILKQIIVHLLSVEYEDPKSIIQVFDIVKDILDDEAIDNVHEEAVNYGLIEAGARALTYLNVMECLDADNVIFDIMAEYGYMKEPNDKHKWSAYVMMTYEHYSQEIDMKASIAKLNHRLSEYNDRLRSKQRLFFLLIWASEVCKDFLDIQINKSEKHNRAREAFCSAENGLGIATAGEFEVSLDYKEEDLVMVVKCANIRHEFTF